MNTHPITTELRQAAESFKDPDHPDFRKLETPVHHLVRGHMIDAVDAHLNDSERTTSERESIDRLGETVDTFSGEIGLVSGVIQNGIKDPEAFRSELRNVADRFGIVNPTISRQEHLTFADVATYLELQKQAVLERSGSTSELLAVEAIGSLVKGWREQNSVSIREAMHSGLDMDKKRDLQRTQSVASTIGQEVLELISRSQGPSQHERSERQNGEAKLSSALHVRLSKIAENNTSIHTSVARDDYDGFDTIGDAPSTPADWLPVNIVEEAKWSGLHVKPNADFPTIEEGLPEIVTFIPQTERKLVKEEQRVGLRGRNTIPAEYKEQAVKMYNPYTKREEPIVSFMYSYSEQRIPDVKLGHELTYHTPATDRPGNMLEVVVPMPQSLAEAFKRELIDDPRKVRGFVEELVKDRGGISPGEWDGSVNPFGLGVRPPTFVKDDTRSERAKRLAARPRIIEPIATSDNPKKLDQMAFEIVA